VNEVWGCRSTATGVDQLFPSSAERATVSALRASAPSRQTLMRGLGWGLNRKEDRCQLAHVSHAV